MDPVLQADANALLIRACLLAAGDLDRLASARRHAEAAGEALLQHLVSGEGAVTHALVEDSPVGLLRDQMLVALAFGELATHTGREDFVNAAIRVRQWADAHLWDVTANQYADAAARSWPESWPEPADDSDDRAPSAMAVAVEVLLAAGEPLRARHIVQGAVLHTAPDRRHAALARQALILAGHP